MRIFKFGGASVKDAEAVKNVAHVLSKYDGEDIAVVVSAMGKTTNALEVLTNCYFHKTGDPFAELEKLRTFHNEILDEIFESKTHSVYDEIANALMEVEWVIEDAPTGTYAFEYDQIVSNGELMSTKIVVAYLQSIGKKAEWLDARDIIKTDNTYREAKIDWSLTQESIDEYLASKFTGDANIVVTQGFVGVTSENFTSTLGREGSDFSAAILAHCMGAEKMTIWKDVPGMLNADPKWFDETLKLDHISYREAIELAYYGATVIHPKTIKPLQNKSIVLYVKSFLDAEEEGTKIDSNAASDELIPSFIFKMNQVLISISARDFSFIVEQNLSQIFGIFAKHSVRIHLMQNSAINFSACVDYNKYKIPELIADLQEHYKVLYNEQLELVTIRHYDQTTIDRVTLGKEILVEQKSRATARMVMKDLGWFDEK